MILLLFITSIFAQFHDRFMVLEYDTSPPSQSDPYSLEMYNRTLKLSVFNSQNMTTHRIKDFNIRTYCGRENCFVDTQYKRIYFLVDEDHREFEGRRELYSVNFKGEIISRMRAEISYPRLIKGELYGLSDKTIVKVGYEKFYPKYELPWNVYEIFGLAYSEKNDIFYIWYNYVNKKMWFWLSKIGL